jgi:hypothetical protein
MVCVQVVLDDDDGLPVVLPVALVVVVLAVEQGGGTNVGFGESGQAA